MHKKTKNCTEFNEAHMSYMLQHARSQQDVLETRLCQRGGTPASNSVLLHTNTHTHTWSQVAGSHGCGGGPLAGDQQTESL